jgi:hypothetical protein
MRKDACPQSQLSNAQRAKVLAMMIVTCVRVAVQPFASSDQLLSQLTAGAFHSFLCDTKSCRYLVGFTYRAHFE